jgi:hypothetical protein
MTNTTNSELGTLSKPFRISSLFLNNSGRLNRKIARNKKVNDPIMKKTIKRSKVS